MNIQKNKSNLLFIKHADFNARTVENDIKILSGNYDVRIYDAKIRKGIFFFAGLLSEFLYLVFNIYRFKIIFIWFADYHSLLPIFFSRVFNKVCIVNIGGYDADEILIGKPESIKGRFRKFCVRYSVKHSDKLLPVSNVIKKYLLTAVEESKCETVYCCVNTEEFNHTNYTNKLNTIITVGGGGEFVKEAKRKRLDFFIELGNEFNKRYPEYSAKFYLIGHEKSSKSHEYLSPLSKSENVRLMPVARTPAEILEYYRNASIYMQLSYYEAFGIAQAEAMLYGCIPVSYAGGAIPEVVGDAGIIFEDYNKEKYLQAIREVLSGKYEELRVKARERVMKNFTLEARKKKLMDILKDASTPLSMTQR